MPNSHAEAAAPPGRRVPMPQRPATLTLVVLVIYGRLLERERQWKARSRVSEFTRDRVLCCGKRGHKPTHASRDVNEAAGAE